MVSRAGTNEETNRPRSPSDRVARERSRRAEQIQQIPVDQLGAPGLPLPGFVPPPGFEAQVAELALPPVFGPQQQAAAAGFALPPQQMAAAGFALPPQQAAGPAAPAATYRRKITLPLLVLEGGYVPGEGFPRQVVENYCVEVNHHVRNSLEELMDNAITPKHYVAMLATHLTGTAKEFYRRLMREQALMVDDHPALSSVDDWLNAIRQEFTDPTVEEFTRQRQHFVTVC